MKEILEHLSATNSLFQDKIAKATAMANEAKATKQKAEALTIEYEEKVKKLDARESRIKNMESIETATSTAKAAIEKARKDQLALADNKTAFAKQVKEFNEKKVKDLADIANGQIMNKKEGQALKELRAKLEKERRHLHAAAAMTKTQE